MGHPLKPGRPPNPIDAVLVVVAWMAIQTIGVRGISFAGAPGWAAMLITFAIGYPLAVFGYAAMAGVDIPATFAGGRRDAALWVAATVATLALWVMVSAAAEPVVDAMERVGLPARAHYEKMIRLVEMLREGGPVVLFGLAAIIGPLGEEWIFRAVWLAAWRGRVPPVAALLVSSAAFGVAHLNYAQVPLTFAVGLHLGILWWWSGGWVLPFWAHVLHNASTLLLYEWSGPKEEMPWPLAAAAVPVYAAAMAWGARRRARGG